MAMQRCFYVADCAQELHDIESIIQGMHLFQLYLNKKTNFVCHQISGYYISFQVVHQEALTKILKIMT